jgi:hypothetical protein
MHATVGVLTATVHVSLLATPREIRIATSTRPFRGRRNLEWSGAIEKGKTDKTTVTRKLKESLAVWTAAYGSSTSNPAGLLVNVSHTNLYYGNIVTYLRMMGLVPPTSGG